jgi:imidazole glycerol-phosphate synthase subunit HisF
VVKGTRFVNLRDVGDPVELASRYEAEGADEVVFLDISASVEGRGTLLDVARRTAEKLFIPLTIGGGVRSTADVAQALRAGADKVAINSAAVRNPEVLSEAAAMFGAQCVVSSIDARMIDGSWRVVTHGGRTATDLDAVEWARECERLGAGEILLTSIDRDGSRNGYDIELTCAVADAVSVPVIASGGAGSARDVVAVIQSGHADAALVAGILHDGTTTVPELKTYMRESLLPVRNAA